MRDHILFIDTEASKLPKDWSASYSKQNNWPNAVQISWVIYSKDGAEIKYENAYVKDNDFTLKKSAVKIHGITRAYLAKEGKGRREILSILLKDIEKYRPLVVGHFMEFDYHILAADLYRAGLDNVLEHTPMFCTMLATKGYLPGTDNSFLKLKDVYSLLFNEVLNDQHNALVDARATAECFFELWDRGYFNEEKIESQNLLVEIEKAKKNVGCVLPFLLVLIIVLATTLL